MLTGFLVIFGLIGSSKQKIDANKFSHQLLSKIWSKQGLDDCVILLIEICIRYFDVIIHNSSIYDIFITIFLLWYILLLQIDWFLFISTGI